MKPMVTRCPQCGTAFRITQAQLQTARGAVRCGSCLTIFKAGDHLTSPPAPKPEPQAKPKATVQTPAQTRPAAATGAAQAAPPQPPSQPAAPQSTASAARPNNHSADDDILISDDMLDDTATFSRSLDDEIDPALLGGKSQPATTSLFGRKLKEEKEQELDSSDETWALSLLEEAEQEQTAAQLAIPSDAPEKPAEKPDDEFQIDVNASVGDKRHSGSEPSSYTDSFTLVDDGEAADDSESAEIEAQFAAEPAAIRAVDPERAAFLSQIEPEPLEMAFRVEPKLWPKRLLWGGLSLLALLGLFVQWNIHHYDQLARMEPYRSWYQTLCPILGCQLPSLSAPEKIRVAQLMVRSHPREAGALVVDVVLLNRAPFEQPFPKLRLTFAKRDGSPVASRDFSPREYLAGELAGREQMPSGQPIHLEIDLLDPGTEAVNYNIDILAP